MMRYIVGIILIVILIIVGVVTFGGNKPKEPVTPAGKALHDYASTHAVVRLTIDGQLNADELHRTIRITVGQSQRDLDVLAGYQGTVIKRQSYPNNQQAYDVFLRALARAGFTKAKKDDKNSDERGVCPTGHRYIYELINGSEKPERLWGATCSGVGTFAGNKAATNSLFQKQINDYDQLINDVQL